jgi:hypothetical protein
MRCAECQASSSKKQAASTQPGLARLRLSDLTPSIPEDPRLKEPSKNGAGLAKRLYWRTPEWIESMPTASTEQGEVGNSPCDAADSELVLIAHRASNQATNVSRPYLA